VYLGGRLEKVHVEFSHEAHDSFKNLRNGPPLIAQLAIRYYNELFEIPPETWGRFRRENGQDTFVSERHCILDIRGVIEEATPRRILRITHFELRKTLQK
jgi:hypothetical protein